MHDFIEDFDRQLQIAADAQAAQSRTAGRRALARPRRLRVAGGMFATAIAATAGFVIISSAGPTATAQALPILSAPATDASGRLPASLQQRVDATQARAIPTPIGTAYYVPGSEEGCLTIPDPGTDQPNIEGGTTCERLDEIDQRGIEIAMLTAEATYVVGVLPPGAPAPTTRLSDGTAQRVRVVDGAVTMALKSSATVTFRSASGKERSVPFPRAGGPGGPPAAPTHPKS